MKRYGGGFDYTESSERLAELESELSEPGVWDNPEKTTPMLKEKSQLEEKINSYDALQQAQEDFQEWIVLAQEDRNDEVLQELNTQFENFSRCLETTELATLLSGRNDKCGALLEIHPGAGGIESQDWAEMLLRMYSRWVEDHNFKLRYLDLQAADEAGIKSATIQIEGTYAFGFLKKESGIHRLIRISPYDASGRRHTSFASVAVYPDLDDDIEIDIKTDDLRIDVFRASGPGGQHVNKTNSAVRITHLPTNIVVQCQNQSSQLKNKQSAMKVLKARLYEEEEKKRDKDKQAEYSGKEAIGFGSQIRTYTLQPYRLVKDHRSNFEDSSVDAVLDGKLDGIIRSLLLHNHGAH